MLRIRNFDQIYLASSALIWSPRWLIRVFKMRTDWVVDDFSECIINLSNVEVWLFKTESSIPYLEPTWELKKFNRSTWWFYYTWFYRGRIKWNQFSSFPLSVSLNGDFCLFPVFFLTIGRCLFGRKFGGFHQNWQWARCREDPLWQHQHQKKTMATKNHFFSLVLFAIRLIIH